MASKTFARTLRAASKQKIAAPALPKRTFISAAVSRPVVANAVRAPIASIQQQSRGLKTIDFAGVKEDVYGTWVVTKFGVDLTENRAL